MLPGEAKRAVGPEAPVERRNVEGGPSWMIIELSGGSRRGGGEAGEAGVSWRRDGCWRGEEYEDGLRRVQADQSPRPHTRLEPGLPQAPMMTSG